MAATVQPDERTKRAVERLSPPRFAPYLAATHGNVKDGLRLYYWNVDLSGAVYESLHLFEVILRNAMDKQLCSWNAAQVDDESGRSYEHDWLLDPSPLLNRLAGRDIAKAKRHAHSATRAQREPGHPDMLAQLSFGTWRYLLPDNDPGRQLLWNQALCHAFPHLRGTSEGLVHSVNGVHKLRNRVAHLEPLLNSSLIRDRLAAMRTVLAAIDPDAENMFTSRQRITPTLKARPELRHKVS